MVVWDQTDYLLEAKKHLSESNTYKEVKFDNNKLVKLMNQSDRMFKKVSSEKRASPEKWKCFSHSFKKATNLGRFYFLPIINKRLHDALDRPVISNCGSPSQNMSEPLDYHLKTITLSAKSYIRDTNDFLQRHKELHSAPQNALLVTADVVGLYPSIPHQDVLKTLSVNLNQREDNKFLWSINLKWVDLFLKAIILNLVQRLNNKCQIQLSGESLLLLTHVFLWIGWIQSFYKRGN